MMNSYIQNKKREKKNEQSESKMFFLTSSRPKFSQYSSGQKSTIREGLDYSYDPKSTSRLARQIKKDLALNRNAVDNIANEDSYNKLKNLFVVNNDS